MKKWLAISLGMSIEAFAVLVWWVGMSTVPPGTASARGQDYASAEPFSAEQLDNLLAPIALYPDPLLAQVLLAATFVDQIDEAARWMRAYNDTRAIDNKPWDVSVKAVAHYPSVLYMMSDQIDWTASVGQAYVYQSTDVMTSIQRLRALANSAGNLVTNPQQEVDVDGDYISIVPVQPQYIYVPTYDPYVVYFGPAPYFGLYPANIIFFGSPFPIGVWLNHDCDWHRHRIYYHGWRGGGWIARSRPVIHVTNVYVNSRYATIQINRNIIYRHVNYINLNRYSSVHRDVTYNNLVRDKRADIRNAGEGNKIIRRNVDVTDPRLDVYHGHAPRQEPAARAKQPPPAQAKPQARQATPPPSTRPPQGARPTPEQTPRDVQRPPRTVFGGSGSVLDPRAASERGRESRNRMSQPPKGGPTSAPRPPAARATPAAPGKR